MSGSGEIAYKHALAMINEHANLQTALENLSGKVEGQLVVTTSLVFSQYILGDVIVDLTKQLPDLEISLRADDGVQNLANDNIDLAFWSCEVGDGNGMARKIGTQTIYHVARLNILIRMGARKRLRS